MKMYRDRSIFRPENSANKFHAVEHKAEFRELIQGIKHLILSESEDRVNGGTVLQSILNESFPWLNKHTIFFLGG